MIDTSRYKIVFVTQDEPFYIEYFFRKFLKAYNYKKIDIKGVYIQETLLNQKSFLDTVFEFYKIFGITVCMGLATRLIRAKFKFFFKTSGLKFVLNKNNVPIKKFSSVNSKEFREWCAKNDVDIIISVANGEIFRTKILETPKLGCWNIHNSKLPFYRGMMPLFWCMWDGASNATVSIHRMLRKLDAGNILEQKSFETSDRSLHELSIECKLLAADLLVDALKDPRAKGTPIEISEGSYFKMPSRADYVEFLKQGNRFF